MQNGSKKNEHLIRFILYSFSYALIGGLMVAMGPLIPYYSERQNRTPSDYSIILLARSIGYIVGSFSVKITQDKFSIHQNLLIGFSIAGIFAILFNYTDNTILRCIYFFMLACGMSITDIFCNVGTVQCYKQSNYESYLQIMHGCLSLGGLIAPFIVYLASLQTYMILGVLCLVLLPAIYFISSPELINSQNVAQLQPEQIQAEPQPKIPLTFSLMVFISASFFIIDGLQSAFGSWISEFSVLRNLSTKQQATAYNSIYWISITFFRFAFAFIGGHPSIKIWIFSFLGFTSSIGSILVIYQIDSSFGLIFSSAFIGFCDASIFALLMTLPTQYGFQVKSTQLSTFILFSVIGEGVVSTLAGVIIDKINPEALFYSTSLYFLFIFINNIVIHKLSSRQQDKSIEMAYNKIISD